MLSTLFINNFAGFCIVLDLANFKEQMERDKSIQSDNSTKS